MTRPTIMWFRRDLRLADNPALHAAACDGPAVACFVVDPAFDRAGEARRAFLDANLRALDASIGGHLVVRHGDPAILVPALADEVGAASVVVAHDYGPYGRRRDETVAAALAHDGRHLRLVGSPYAVAPGTVVKSDSARYAVFTPYSRRWAQAGWDRPIDPPAVDWRRAASSATGAHLPSPTIDMQLPPAGEGAADDRLHDFVATSLATYASDRDRPALDGTSRLSPYLRFGVVHPRQLLARLGDTESERRFRIELAWRDFYADVLFHRPDSAWHALQPRMARLPVDTDAPARRRFARWRAGETGYPIVDAGMRQLLATGWMHNRVRMIVASFLVKDLHLPWQWGARHFMRHLVDGDLASNNHGWQWAAGTGTDAAPYYRVFNPVTQSERYDPDGVYIRRWVRELVDVADGIIHAPWTSRRGHAGQGPLGYPPPMVDHATERAEALRRLALVQSGAL